MHIHYQGDKIGGFPRNPHGCCSDVWTFFPCFPTSKMWKFFWWHSWYRKSLNRWFIDWVPAQLLPNTPMCQFVFLLGFVSAESSDFQIATIFCLMKPRDHFPTVFPRSPSIGCEICAYIFIFKVWMLTSACLPIPLPFNQTKGTVAFLPHFYARVGAAFLNASSWVNWGAKVRAPCFCCCCWSPWSGRVHLQPWSHSVPQPGARGYTANLEHLVPCRPTGVAVSMRSGNGDLEKRKGDHHFT